MSRIKQVLEEERGEQFTIMGNVFTNNNNNVDLGDPERELPVPISGDSGIESGVLPETAQVSGEGASVPTTIRPNNADHVIQRGVAEATRDRDSWETPSITPQGPEEVIEGGFDQSGENFSF